MVGFLSFRDLRIYFRPYGFYSRLFLSSLCASTAVGVVVVVGGDRWAAVVCPTSDADCDLKCPLQPGDQDKRAK